MVAIEKKYIKVGVVALAAVALVIGLSVGITQSNKNKSASKAAASDGYAAVTATFDDEVLENCTSSSKSGKSGGGGSTKSGKSGGNSTNNNSTGRRLVVPGTEDYDADAGAGKRRKLRNDLLRDLQQNVTSAKSSKSTAEGSTKSSKSSSNSTHCINPKDICESGGTKSGKSGGGGSSKSGKSGGSKSSTNSPTTSSSPTSDPLSSNITNYCSSSKSGKSGGGGTKSGKSGGNSTDTVSRSTKSSKSNSTVDDDDDDCIPRPPSVCATPQPSVSSSPSISLQPVASCVCEDLNKWVFTSTSGTTGTCKRSCDNTPGEGQGQAHACCNSNLGSSVKGPCKGFPISDDCAKVCKVDDCGKTDILVPPTPAPYSKLMTPEPTPTTPAPTPTVSAGSTPTVSTEVTGPPTVSRPTVPLLP